jgi:Bacterial archaeo-eukaryotic release factor family 3
MTIKSSQEFAAVLNAPAYLPCISIIMPFEPKMNLKEALLHKLKLAADNVEDQLLENYPDEKSKPIITRLRQLIKELNFNTHKRSVAIFLSPLIEKVYYLDIPMEERIVIDESFEIRDLIYSKKQIHKYLLVVLSSKWVKIYLGNTTEFIRITYVVPDNIAAYENDISEKIANFSDQNKRKEIMLNKFLLHIDNGLTLLRKSYKLPLFVMGAARTVGHFKKITHNGDHVIDYIHGNFENKTVPELKALMEPYVADWKKVIQTDLLQQIEEALNHRKLAVGMDEVWKSASQKRARLLVVEKNFIFPADKSSTPGIIYKREESVTGAFYIKDAVDDVIEKVLANGGDVEFVDEGVLEGYSKIVLIEFYNLN